LGEDEKNAQKTNKLIGKFLAETSHYYLDQTLKKNIILDHVSGKFRAFDSAQFIILYFSIRLCSF